MKEAKEMTDEEIVSGIQSQLVIAMGCRMAALHCERFYEHAQFGAHAQRKAKHLNKMAGLFTAHAIRLIASHKAAVMQWMETKASKDTQL